MLRSISGGVRRTGLFLLLALVLLFVFGPFFAIALGFDSFCCDQGGAGRCK